MERRLRAPVFSSTAWQWLYYFYKDWILLLGADILLLVITMPLGILQFHKYPIRHVRNTRKEIFYILWELLNLSLLHNPLLLSKQRTMHLVEWNTSLTATSGSRRRFIFRESGHPVCHFVSGLRSMQMVLFKTYTYYFSYILYFDCMSVPCHRSFHLLLYLLWTLILFPLDLHLRFHHSDL